MSFREFWDSIHGAIAELMGLNEFDEDDLNNLNNL